ncbi:MAG: hypothetical protein J6B74_03910 [Ruminococcus sp.]|nr:hypothetical protein [Ruminococcus sp.]
MSTREMAYNIFNQLNEEQLKGFIAMFERFYPVQENKTNEKITAFEELEKLHRTISDIDEENELNEWRTEKYKI